MLLLLYSIYNLFAIDSLKFIHKKFTAKIWSNCAEKFLFADFTGLEQPKQVFTA
ncbi:hypothetical protein CLOSTMETH_02233 [[Clostridium] methylpentosum DSM 5476]|uniref:Uncharacterized protein n=1 Tax=[Clostridium] methylpentosum DSM 5476 TaxID=537013 RepID=C0EEE7_9FIRM|nr:hypothetical protein CLOSTMETH_02233 [[Clostridium] methylpentosum DSM 5476]